MVGCKRVARVIKNYVIGRVIWGRCYCRCRRYFSGGVFDFAKMLYTDIYMYIYGSDWYERPRWHSSSQYDEQDQEDLLVSRIHRKTSHSRF